MENGNPIGVIGGSGLYELPELKIEEEIKLDTPFGEPSDQYIVGKINGVGVIFLSRHGRGHLHPASAVNYRANIYGFKKLHVDALIGVSAVGSMKDKYHPTDIVIPNQFYDNTRGRENTFFSRTPAVHIGIADPTCPILDEILYTCGKEIEATIHKGGTYICIEGPAFSTRAESNIYRVWGVDIIGMSFATEAKLAREAEICYSSLSLVTDYDVWKETEEDVNVDIILSNQAKATTEAREIIQKAIPRIQDTRECLCRGSMKEAIASNPDLIGEETLSFYGPLLDKYLPLSGR